MIKFLGILSTKNKVTTKKAARLLVETLDEAIVHGFVEIQDFLNNNNNLEGSPNLTVKDIRWFRLIVFVGNLKISSDFFDHDNAEDLYNNLLDYMADKMTGDNEIAIEQLNDYASYLDELLRRSDNCIEAMATAIFDKYNINEFQVNLFRRKNEPNPVLFQELKNLMGHFIWNWEDYLNKNKIIKG
jgi:hypothetical protein|tara:strand:- start:4108 stop:4665 length:558 start_codon:yes stop_codon:yes gene_type:complete